MGGWGRVGRLGRRGTMMIAPQGLRFSTRLVRCRSSAWADRSLAFPRLTKSQSPCLAAQMIEDAGFRGVDYENLTFGVVAIHSGFKLA